MYWTETDIDSEGHLLQEITDMLNSSITFPQKLFDGHPDLLNKVRELPEKICPLYELKDLIRQIRFQAGACLLEKTLTKKEYAVAEAYSMYLYTLADLIIQNIIGQAAINLANIRIYTNAMENMGYDMGQTMDNCMSTIIILQDDHSSIKEKKNACRKFKLRMNKYKNIAIPKEDAAASIKKIIFTLVDEISDIMARL